MFGKVVEGLFECISQLLKVAGLFLPHFFFSFLDVIHIQKCTHSVAFNRDCSHHCCPIPEHCRHSRDKPCTCSSHTLPSCLRSWQLLIYFGSLWICLVGVSSKWNHIICRLFCQASFTLHNQGLSMLQYASIPYPTYS